jgi:hypothetical protein
MAQDQPSQNPAGPTAPDMQTITIPAGSHIAMVLTQPVQSRVLRRGDDIYAQITSPVDSGNQVAIPPGTFVQAQVAKIEIRGGRGELHVQSMAITFPDGYVAQLSGPATLYSDEGYALKDPSHGRMAAAFALPAAGAGLGALIGHSIGSSSTTVTSTLPPGCTGPPPGCLTSSVTGPGNVGMHTAEGAGIGIGVGGVASLVLLASSHHFYLDAGAPIEMQLQQPVTLQQGEVAKAVQESAQRAVSIQPVAPRPVYLPPPMDTSTPSPATSPGTPPIIIPGPPGPGGVPGAPIIIPGTPPGA